MYNSITISNEKIITQIKDLIETVRVYVNNDGGDLDFVSYENNILTIKILGACATCPHVTTTFDDGIRHIFLNEIPEIKEVKFI